MTLKEAIKRVKGLLGNDIIYDSRIVSALNDFGAFRDKPAYRNIIRSLVDEGLIFEYARATVYERGMIIQRVVNLYGFEISLIKDVFSSFFDEDTMISNYMPLQDKNGLTEIIFVIDCSSEAASCYASMKFFFDTLKSSVRGSVSVRIVRYSDSTEWVVKDGMELGSIVLPDAEQMVFEGTNNLSQALRETCNSNIKWESTVADPIIIWMAATQPQDSFQETLSKLWGEDILYNRAYRISISFGRKISAETLTKFATDKDLVFSSIEIEEIIRTIESHLGHDIHDHVEDVLNDPGEELYIKKCKEQTDAAQRHQERLKKYAGGIFAFKEDGKWGWKKVTGEIIVSPQYKTIKEFQEGLAAVSSRGFHGRPISEIFTWGFINIQGQKVIQEDYDEVENFFQGTAIVHKECKGWGVINKKGDVIIPCEYNSIVRTENDLFRVISKSNKYGLYTIYGRQICEERYDYISDFIYGFAIVKDNCETYLMKSNGRIISRLPSGVKFSPIEGILEVEKWQPKVKTVKGLCGYDGVEILPNIYTDITFGESYILTCSDEGYDVFDLYGQKLNSDPYLNAKINGRFLAVQTKDKIWHHFDNNGLGVRIPFNDVYYIFDNGSLLVEYRFVDNPKIKYIATVSPDGELLRRPYVNFSDKPISVIEKGEDLILLQLQDSYSRTFYYVYISKANGLLYNRSDNGSGIKIKDEFVIVIGNFDAQYPLYNLNTGMPMTSAENEDGKTVVRKFTELQLPSDVLCRFKECGKYGFIDCCGKRQLEPIYDQATDFHNVLAVVSIGNETFLIDKEGYRITNENCDEIKFVQFPIEYGEV